MTDAELRRSLLIIRLATLLQARRALGQPLFQTEEERELAAALGQALAPFVNPH